MRTLLRIAAFLMFPVMIVGVIECADALVCLYMVEVAGAVPGEPMYVDDLAPTPAQALVELSVGLSTVMAAAAAHWALRRKLAKIK